MPDWARDSDSDFHFVSCREPEDGAAKIVEIVKDRIPARFGLDPVRDVQVLCPMNRGRLGARSLNLELQQALNPPGEGAIERFGWTFGVGDKVMQAENDYDKDVYNGDLGFVARMDLEAGEMIVEFDGREVAYGFGELDELVLAYATTVHKSQGSEYPAGGDPAYHATLSHAAAQSGLHRRDSGQTALGHRRATQGDGDRGSGHAVSPALVEARRMATFSAADEGDNTVSFAIIRGSNGRRHEVNFGDAEVAVDVVVGSETVQITIEATKSPAPSHKRRFATVALPREKLAAAMGADLKGRRGRAAAEPLRLISHEE